MKKSLLIMCFLLLAAGALCGGCGKKVLEADPSHEITEPSKEEKAEAPASESESDPEPEAESETEPELITYAEEKGLVFTRETTIMTKGIRTDPENPEDSDVVDNKFEIFDVHVENEADGQKTIVFDISNQGNIWIENPVGKKKNVYTGAMSALCDLYTGKVFPGVTTFDDAEWGNSTEVEWAGETYPISYSKKVQWNQGEWSGFLLEENGYVCLMESVETFRITVPDDYDGLAVLVVPMLEYVTEEQDREQEDYIQDYLDYYEGQCHLIRISDLLEEQPI